MKLRKTSAVPSWTGLTHDQRDLLARLCLESLDGIWLGHLTVAQRRDADALLVRSLVTWRDGILCVNSHGLRLFLLESGLVGRRTG